MENPNVKNLIFDLGAVILNINLRKTAFAFAALANREVDWIDQKINHFGLFARYESGEWTDEQFRESVRAALELPLADDQIDQAWNALLLDFPPARINLIRWLQPRYRTFLLSNTNPIHIRQVDQILLRDTGYSSLRAFFEKAYLSYEMKKIKPSSEIYEQVLTENGLLPEETLFFDDNLHNIQAANQLGIHTVHIQEPATILDYFPNAPIKS